MAATKIEWATHVWNPVRGCSRVSEGCRNCYAERQAGRFGSEGQPFDGFVREANPGRVHGYPRHASDPRWTGRVELIDSKLREPLSWRKPRERVFVNSMSDLFHEALSDEAIDRVFAVMALCPESTFLVLTKRAERMRRYFAAVDDLWESRWPRAMQVLVGECEPTEFPLANVWLGCSVEDQATADERIPHLLATPAALRFVSYEPALGPVDFSRIEGNADIVAAGGYSYRSTVLAPDPGDPASFRAGLDWIIAGGESGPSARPSDVAWLRSVVEQGRDASVPVFVKQLGARPYEESEGIEDGATVSEARCVGQGWITRRTAVDRFEQRQIRSRKGADPSEWPEDLRVRQMPRLDA